MAKTSWYYERLKDDGTIQHAPMNDADGKITGRHVFGLKEWFDENPAERIRLGWVKHITHETKDIEYDHATQYIQRFVKTVDEHTVEDEYRIMQRSPEMMRMEELGHGLPLGDDIESIEWRW